MCFAVAFVRVGEDICWYGACVWMWGAFPRAAVCVWAYEKGENFHTCRTVELINAHPSSGGLWLRVLDFLRRASKGEGKFRNRILINKCNEADLFCKSHRFPFRVRWELPGHRLQGTNEEIRLIRRKTKQFRLYHDFFSASLLNLLIHWRDRDDLSFTNLSHMLWLRWWLHWFLFCFSLITRSKYGRSSNKNLVCCQEKHKLINLFISFARSGIQTMRQ